MTDTQQQTKTYIVAANARHADLVAFSRDLAPSQWRYASQVHVLHGVGAGSTILKYETCRDRSDWYEMHHAIVWAEQRGARVIQVREGDLR